MIQHFENNAVITNKEPDLRTSTQSGFSLIILRQSIIIQL